MTNTETTNTHVLLVVSAQDGGYYVGVPTGDYDMVGTPDETTTMDNVVKFDRYGNVVRFMDGLETLVSSAVESPSDDPDFRAYGYWDVIIDRAGRIAAEISELQRRLDYERSSLPPHMR